MGASKDETGGAPVAADATRTGPNLAEDPTLTGGTPVPAEADATLDATLDDTSQGSPHGGLVGSLTPEHPRRYAVGPDPRDGVDVLGQGGMGRVLRGFDRHLGREIAIKELLGGAISHAPYASPRTSPTLARFVREARITAQLEHPSIVPVHELGVRPDGTLYYTMKRVRGRTLEDALAAAGGLDGRLGLVGHVLDLCHAIAYAHARGVIHRDIKPANVMVGEFGETIVLDWGLARLRGGADADARDRPDRMVRLPDDDGSDPGRTVAGEAFGTPSTMSPEQARGDVEAVDERSDVWSLGAVLYHLLTGRPPFVGDTARAVITKAREATATPVRALEPGAPPELAAIAERALRRAPEERYPSAGAMARDLEAWTAGRRVEAHSYTSWELLRRFVDRHRVPVVVSAVAAVLLLVAGVTAHLRVLEARDRAAEQRDAARQFASYLVNDVSESIASLAGAGAVRKEVLDRALSYYEQAVGAEDASPEERRTLAVGTIRVGELAIEAGELGTAERAFARAEPLLRALVAQSPDDPQALVDLALWAEDSGKLDLARGRDEAARAAFGEAKGLTERALAAEPRHLNARRAEARVAHSLGVIALTRGPTDAAGPLLRRSLELELELLEEHPDDDAATTNAVHSYHSLAHLALVRHGVDEAISALEHGMAIGEERLRAAPHDVDAQVAVLAVREELVDIFMSQGETARAVEVGREALATAERLRAQDPWSASRRRAVCRVQLSLAHAIGARGDGAEARALAQRALETQEAMLLQEPTSAVARREVTQALHVLALLLSAEGQNEEARSLFERALPLHRELLAEQPESAELLRDLAVAQEHLAGLEWALGQVAGAEERYREVLAARERLLAKDPANLELAHDVSVVLGHLAGIARAQGRMQEARAIGVRSVEARRRVAAADPRSVTKQVALARGLEELALTTHHLGELEASLDAYEEALDIGARLMAAAEPEQIGRRRDLLPPYTRAYQMAAYIGQAERARGFAERARELAEELLAGAPDDPLVLQGLQAAVQALGDYDRYVEASRRMQEVDPDEPAHVVEVLEALVLAQRYDEARELAPRAVAASLPCTATRRVAWAWSAMGAGLRGDAAEGARLAQQAAEELSACPLVEGSWSFVLMREAVAGRTPAGAACAALIAELVCDGQPGCDTPEEALRRFSRALQPR